MYAKLFFYLFCVLSATQLQAQKTTIFGKIIDKETKQPISGANVYLSDTMVGTSADENGNYSFSTNFNGTFLLVATFVGYRTKKRIIEISYDSVLIENFELNASISKLDEIVVTASNKEWRRNYDLFKKFFLGDDEFAQQTFIENPESIYFKRSNDKKTISVYSEERIFMSNYALGYQVRVALDNVVFDPFDNTGVYLIYPHFTQMESSSRKQNRTWKRNRTKGYIGSSRHFFKSLVSDKVKTNQFTILPNRNVIKKTDNIDLIKSLYPEHWGSIIGNYSSYLVSDINMSISHRLDLDYIGNIVDHNQLSNLEIKNRYYLILINKQGILYDPQSVQFLGKWSLDRFAKHLPLDYNP